MRQTRSHALTAVISLVACSNAHAFKICVEKSSGLAEFEAIASNISASTGETWGAVVGGSASKCRDMLKAGTANLADLDAGKAYGVLLDSIKNSWPTGGGAALGKVGAGYQTMAVTRLDKMKADNVQTLCDILNKKTWRACHTGYMKSAGWVSPMGAIQTCAASGPSWMRAACGDLTKVGATCHEAMFGDSCVPDIVNGKSGDSSCKQCTGGSCSSSGNAYSNYYGAAKGVIDGVCDIAFVKTSTWNCPGYPAACQTTQMPGVSGARVRTCAARCLARVSSSDATSCADSKSVYAKGYNTSTTTYVKVPGYGQYMPPHIVVAVGVPANKLAALKTALKSAYQTVNGDTFYEASAAADPIKDIEAVLGAQFVQTMRRVPYFFEKNGLTRPASDKTIVYTAPVPSQGNSATGTGGDAKAPLGGIIAAVVVAALALIALAVLVTKERAGNPLFTSLVAKP